MTTASRDVPLMRNGAFLRLFAAQATSLVGSGVTTVGLAMLSYELAGKDATAVLGNALMLRILAFLLFSQPAGVLADRIDRKTILISSDLARCGLLALFPFVSEIWQIYVLVFVVNALTACFTPTYEASIPSLVGDRQYVRALAISRVAVDLETVGGPVVAGLLVVWLGLRWVFWLDSLTYLVSAALILSVAVPNASAKTTRWLEGLVSDIPYGTRLLLRVPALRQALALSMAEATAGAVAIVVTISYVRESLKLGETVYPWLMAALGMGSALMAVVLGQYTRSYEGYARDAADLHRRRHRWTGWALLTGGLLLAIALLPGLWEPPLTAFALLWLLNGAGQAMIAIPSATLVAEHTAEQERGRAYAAHFALTHACWLVSYPMVGHLAARWGAPLTISVGGGVCLLVTVVALFLGTNSRRFGR